MTIKTASAKKKGSNLQKLVRDKLRLILPQLHPDDITSQPMGQAGEDIIQSPAAREALTVPISIECKAYAKFSVLRHYEQCQKNARPGENPVLIIKENRGKPMAIVDLDHYLDLVKNYGK